MKLDVKTLLECGGYEVLDVRIDNDDWSIHVDVKFGEKQLKKIAALAEKGTKSDIDIHDTFKDLLVHEIAFNGLGQLYLVLGSGDRAEVFDVLEGEDFE